MLQRRRRHLSYGSMLLHTINRARILVVSCSCTCRWVNEAGRLLGHHELFSALLLLTATSMLKAVHKIALCVRMVTEYMVARWLEF